jgi:DNA-binding transcriptional LysR family regulator
VSRQIRLLEEWLGTSLFLRTSRNAVPTRAGTDLLADAGLALDRLASASLRLQSGKAREVLPAIDPRPRRRGRRMRRFWLLLLVLVCPFGASTAGERI